MERITKARLEAIVANCNREAYPDPGWKYAIEYAYGKPRLVLEDSNLCCRDVSPRLAAGKLAEWIWAYLEGIRAMNKAVRACECVLQWAKTPGNHGGNPYCMDFVKAARKALNDLP